MVLAKKNFRYAIPVYHSERPFGDDPDAGVFVRVGNTRANNVLDDETNYSHSVELRLQ